VLLVVQAQVEQGRFAGAEGRDRRDEPGVQAVGVDRHAQGDALIDGIEGAERGHGALQIALEHADLLDMPAQPGAGLGRHAG
jgi:hypothetical protein